MLYRTLIPAALVLALTTSDTRSEDLAAIVATAGRPGLKDRIVAYRDKLAAEKAARKPAE